MLLHLQKPRRGAVYRNQYIFGLPEEIEGAAGEFKGALDYQNPLILSVHLLGFDHDNGGI